MNKTVLITAAEKDLGKVVTRLKEGDKREASLLQLPLERYKPAAAEQEVNDVFENIDRFENIVYGSKRNAIFFLEQVEQHERIKKVRQRLNLAVDAEAADFLEENGILSVYPGSEKPIKLVEFMLRLRRHGHTLYPAGSHQKEEIPGLLNELDIPVTELELFELEGPEKESLDRYREKISSNLPDLVVFHSRRSVNRTLAAFPDLDYASLEVISASAGVTKKLKEENIEVDVQASSNWKSIVEEIEKIINPGS